MSQFKSIMEQLIKEAEDKAKIDALSQAMSAGFATMGSELSAKEDELKADVEQADIKLNESFTVISVIGMLLAAPKVAELVIKGFSKVVSVFKKLFKPKQAKTEDEQSAMVEWLLKGVHKWHKGYIKALKWILKKTGVFKKAGIQGDDAQEKAAELVYYVVLAGLAVYSGIGAASAFKSAASASGTTGDLAMGAVEAAMNAIKTTEVADFLAKLGLNA